ncbi:hypothetical protein JHJ32_21520 [Parapedobacter sp. ISTM3]|uniref:hypothetical protein n=1 Tax=Parapedobacter sp. ISTM3 TaxID=2800130 RepID=UPI001904E902|nr:hypothetical protein [Parapedobacter sp. ISTM3]MBK1442594.1 hypothetical protein [Parapedobacter sp. ISTM3]
MMKRTIKTLTTALIMLGWTAALSQVTELAPGNYRSIVINPTGNGDHTRGLILLHEMYDGANLNMNYAIGTITALRGNAGGVNRLNIAQVNSSSAYQSTSAHLVSIDNSSVWKLKTCRYNGKKYLAIEVPYSPPYHNHGFKFVGWTVSSAENMRYVSYEQSGTPVNTNVLSEIADYQPNMPITQYASSFTIHGNVGIGASPTEKLSVNGNIRAKEVKVEMANWPDYVFGEEYDLMPLPVLESHIKTHGHLPGIPNAQEAEAEGIGLAEMNRKLLEKVEELTLHLIEKDKENKFLQGRLSAIEQHIGIKQSYEK